MRNVITACLVALLLASLFIPARAEFRHLSSRLIPSVSSDAMYPDVLNNAQSKLLAANASGVYLIVHSSGGIFFDGSIGYRGIVGARLDNSIAHTAWSRTFPGSAFITGLAPEADGSLVLVGYFPSNVDFGGGVITPNAQDLFVVKLDAAGRLAWQHAYGALYFQTAFGVAIASNGDILMIGSNDGAIDFGAGYMFSNGGTDVIVARFDGTTGAHIWSREFGTTARQDGVAITNGPDGDIALLCSVTGGSIDFGGGYLPRSGGNIAIAMLDANGNHIWSRVVGGTQGGTPADIAVDNAGRTVICGRFGRGFDPGNGVLLEARPYAVQTGFVSSYDTDGTYRWSFALTDSLQSEITGVATTTSGECIAKGRARNRFVAPGANVPAAGFLLMEFDSLGNVSAARGFGAAGSYTTSFLATLGDDIYLAGSTDSPIDFGGESLRPPGGTRIYTAHLAVRRPPQVTIADFTARTRSATDVELRWNVTSGEPLAKYYLSRRTPGSSRSTVIYYATAADAATSFMDEGTEPGHSYEYELTVETALGDPVTRSTIIEVPAIKTTLGQNSPNPFNPLTTFPYTLAAPAEVTIAIYDLSGALIARIEEGMQPAGRHEARWAGHNGQGSLVSSGVYFYRLEGAGDIPARKMVLLK